MFVKTFKTMSVVSILSLGAGLSGCGWFDFGPAPAATQQTHAALTMDDVLRLGMTHQNRSVTPVLYRAGPDDSWTVMQESLRQIQITMGRADDTDAFNHGQKIRKAFIMAARAQAIMPQIEYIIAHSGQDHDIETLKDFYARLNAGRHDLAQILGLPDGGLPPLDATPISMSETIPALADLELLALNNRPEIRMEMDHAIDAETLRQQILTTFPGVQKILARHPDQAGWNDFAKSYSQSLNRLFTMPLQMKDDTTRAMLTRLRQESLGAAVLAQVHMAHDRYQTAHANAAAASAILTEINALSQPSAPAQLSAEAAQVLTQAQLYAAFTDLLHAVGKSGTIRALQNKNPLIQDAVYDGTAYITETGLINTATSPRIPFAQKISGQQGEGAVTIARAMREQTSPLDLPGRAIRKLLDAPISEP